MKTALLDACLYFHSQQWQRCLEVLGQISQSVRAQKNHSELSSSLLQLVSLNMAMCENRVRSLPLSALTEQLLSQLPSLISALSPDQVLLSINVAHFLYRVGHVDQSATLLYQSLRCILSQRMRLSAHTLLYIAMKLSPICESSSFCESKVDYEATLEELVKLLDGIKSPFFSPLLLSNVGVVWEQVTKLHRLMLLCSLSRSRSDYLALQSYLAEYYKVMKVSLAEWQGRGLAVEIVSEGQLLLLPLVGEVGYNDGEREGERGRVVSVKINTAHYWHWFYANLAIFSPPHELARCYSSLLSLIDPSAPPSLLPLYHNRLALLYSSHRGWKTHSLLHHLLSLSSSLSPFPSLSSPRHSSLSPSSPALSPALLYNVGLGCQLGGQYREAYVFFLSSLLLSPLQGVEYRLGESIVQMYLGERGERPGVRGRLVKRGETYGLEVGSRVMEREKKMGREVETLLSPDLQQLMGGRGGGECGLEQAVSLFSLSLGQTYLGERGRGGEKRRSRVRKSCLLHLCYLHCELGDPATALSYASSLVERGAEHLSIAEREVVGRVYLENQLYPQARALLFSPLSVSPPLGPR